MFYGKKVFLIYGLSGVGKTTLLENIIKNKEILYINFGDLFFDIAKSKGFVGNRDELTKLLDLEQYKEIYHQVIDLIEEIIFNSMEKKVVIDTHLILNTNFGIFIGIQKKLIKKIKPDYLIFIKAKPEEILERRKKDKTRKRSLESIEQIKNEIIMAENLSLCICFESGAIFKEINNNNGKLTEAREELEKIILNY